MVEHILKTIGSIPPLDDTVTKIQLVCSNPNSSIDDLNEVASGDPVLTANILKSANSPLYGFSREINSISQAISLFGMVTIKGFALASAMKKSMKIDLKPYNIPNQKFLDICTSQSSLMLHWYTKVNRELLQILIPSAFMMELGKIILANVATSLNRQDDFQALIKNSTNINTINQIEQEFFDISSDEVTAKIFEKWNLEIECADAIRFSTQIQEAPKHILELSQALCVVKTIINIHEQLTPESISAGVELAKSFGLDTNILNHAIDKLSN